MEMLSNWSNTDILITDSMSDSHCTSMSLETRTFFLTLPPCRGCQHANTTRPTKPRFGGGSHRMEDNTNKQTNTTDHILEDRLTERHTHKHANMEGDKADRRPTSRGASEKTGPTSNLYPRILESGEIKDTDIVENSRLDFSESSQRPDFEIEKTCKRDVPNNIQIASDVSESRKQSSKNGCVETLSSTDETVPVKEKLMTLLSDIGVKLPPKPYNRTLPDTEDIIYCKNLFLKDRKGQFYLVIVAETSQVDLKVLKQQLGAHRNLSFADQSAMNVILQVKPGAVTPFALLHNSASNVKLAIEQRLWVVQDSRTKLAFHPLDPNLQVELSKAQLEMFLEKVDVKVLLIGCEGNVTSSNKMAEQQKEILDKKTNKSDTETTTVDNTDLTHKQTDSTKLTVTDKDTTDSSKELKNQKDSTIKQTNTLQATKGASKINAQQTNDIVENKAILQPSPTILTQKSISDEMSTIYVPPVKIRHIPPWFDRKGKLKNLLKKQKCHSNEETRVCEDRDFSFNNHVESQTQLATPTPKNDVSTVSVTSEKVVLSPRNILPEVKEFYSFFNQHNISYDEVDLSGSTSGDFGPALGCRMIALKDKKGNFFIVITHEFYEMDYGRLKKALQPKRKLKLCDPDDILFSLRIDPTRLSPLALTNSSHSNVYLTQKILYPDIRLVIQHPFAQGHRIVMTSRDLQKFLASKKLEGKVVEEREWEAKFNHIFTQFEKTSSESNEKGKNLDIPKDRQRPSETSTATSLAHVKESLTSIDLSRNHSANTEKALSLSKTMVLTSGVNTSQVGQTDHRTETHTRESTALLSSLSVILKLAQTLTPFFGNIIADSKNPVSFVDPFPEGETAGDMTSAQLRESEKAEATPRRETRKSVTSSLESKEHIGHSLRSKSRKHARACIQEIDKGELQKGLAETQTQRVRGTGSESSKSRSSSFQLWSLYQGLRNVDLELDEPVSEMLNMRTLENQLFEHGVDFVVRNRKSGLRRKEFGHGFDYGDDENNDDDDNDDDDDDDRNDDDVIDNNDRSDEDNSDDDDDHEYFDEKNGTDDNNDDSDNDDDDDNDDEQAERDEEKEEEENNSGMNIRNWDNDTDDNGANEYDDDDDDDDDYELCQMLHLKDQQGNTYLILGGQDDLLSKRKFGRRCQISTRLDIASDQQKHPFSLLMGHAKSIGQRCLLRSQGQTGHSRSRRQTNVTRSSNLTSQYIVALTTSLYLDPETKLRFDIQNHGSTIEMRSEEFEKYCRAMGWEIWYMP